MRWVSRYGRHDNQEWELVKQGSDRGLSLGSVVRDDGMYIAYSGTGDRESFSSLGEAKGWVEAQVGGE